MFLRYVLKIYENSPAHRGLCPSPGPQMRATTNNFLIFTQTKTPATPLKCNLKNDMKMQDTYLACNFKT